MGTTGRPLDDWQSIEQQMAYIQNFLNALVHKHNYYYVPNGISYNPRGEILTEEKFPVSERLKVVDGITLSKSDKWWSAVVALESFGRRQVCIYLWNKRGDEWKRRQKFLVRGRQNWEKIKASVDKFLPYLTGEPKFAIKET